MKTVFHQADTRGHANYGWLNSHHTFSFAGYHNPNRIHFGALRVLNDDCIAGGTGFGKHPHQDMEIISIALDGDLKHADDMGNQGVISKGEIQVMSAGTGIYHSEQNGNAHKQAEFLQIWVIPNKMNVTPRYDQKRFDTKIQKNTFHPILAPQPSDVTVWIHQNAWFYWAHFDSENSLEYHLKDIKNGVYIFVIRGSIQIANQTLSHRDGLGIYDTQSFGISAQSESEFLLMEIPMEI